jgi:hypothetical protein
MQVAQLLLEHGANPNAGVDSSGCCLTIGEVNGFGRSRRELADRRPKKISSAHVPIGRTAALYYPGTRDTVPGTTVFMLSTAAQAEAAQ